MNTEQTSKNIFMNKIKHLTNFMFLIEIRSLKPEVSIYKRYHQEL